MATSQKFIISLQNFVVHIYLRVILCTHCSMVMFSHKIATFNFLEKQILSIGYAKKFLKIAFGTRKNKPKRS